jgi:hypothetical protein
MHRSDAGAEQGGTFGMQALFFTRASGWILVALAATTIALPFLLRRNALSLALGLVHARGTPYLRRMRPHYLAGYLITGTTLAHAVVPMQAGLAVGANAAGLYLATGALFLLFGQVALGRSLRRPDVDGRRGIRRWHFWGMVGIVTLGVGHIVLNSPGLRLPLR